MNPYFWPKSSSLWSEAVNAFSIPLSAQYLPKANGKSAEIVISWTFLSKFAASWLNLASCKAHTPVSTDGNTEITTVFPA